MLHNIHDKEGRVRALSEIVRVLKPTGSVTILDIARTSEYARELRRLGMTDARASRTVPLWMMPLGIVRATKE
jgi:ubiquinone/menaquinone biosynthesis C-methylase UbiE